MSNSTVSKNGLITASSALVSRNCNGPNAFCTPFFPLFTPSFPLYETIFSTRSSNQTFVRGINLPDIWYRETLKEYAATFANPYQGHQPTPESQSLMLAYNTSVPTNDEFDIESYAATVVDGNSGEITMASSSKIIFSGSTSPTNKNQKTLAVLNTVNANFYLSGELLDMTGNPHACCTGSEKRSIQDEYLLEEIRSLKSAIEEFKKEQSVRDNLIKAQRDHDFQKEMRKFQNEMRKYLKNKELEKNNEELENQIKLNEI
jgi:hypothetical protein